MRLTSVPSIIILNFISIATYYGERIIVLRRAPIIMTTFFETEWIS